MKNEQTDKGEKDSPSHENYQSISLITLCFISISISITCHLSFKIQLILKRILFDVIQNNYFNRPLAGLL